MHNEIYKRGYTVLPIIPSGKAPTVTGWSTQDPELLLTCFKDGDGTGARCGDGDLIGVDIDVYDSGIAGQMLAWIQMYHGIEVIPYRVGEHPKFLIPMRCPEARGKLVSKKFHDPDDVNRVHAIEILSHGQQFITSGIHQTTGQPYTWHDGELPPLADLPVVSMDFINSLFEYFDLIAVSHGLVEVVTVKPVDVQTDLQRGYNNSVSVVDMLQHYGWKFMGGENRWQRPGKSVGISGTVTENTFYCFTSSTVLEGGVNNRPWDIVLGYRFNGDVEAMETFATEHVAGVRASVCAGAGFGQGADTVLPVGASEQTPVEQVMGQVLALPFNGGLLHHDQWFPVVYNAGLPPADLKTVLRVMGDDGRIEGGRRDIQQQYKLMVDQMRVKESGGLLEYMQERFVYMRNGNQVIDTEKPPQHAIMTLPEFRTAFTKKGSVFLEGSKKSVPVVTGFFMNEDYKSVLGERFHPNEEIIYHADGVNWFNPANFKEFSMVTGENLIVPILNHLQYLFPDEQYERIMDWIAWTVHEPGTRIKFTPLLISRHHGTGRGWMVELVAKLLGEWNCSTVEISDLAEGQYHDYMHRSVFCALHEVYVKGRDAFKVDDAIRSKLTDETFQMNLKYGKNGSMPVFTNFMMMSNHRNALAVTEEDRRIEVFEHFSVGLAESVYDELYGLLGNDDAMAQMFWYLHRQYVARQGVFNPNGRATMSKAKKRLIGGTRSEIDYMFKDIIDKHKSDIISVRTVKELVKLKATLSGDKSHIEIEDFMKDADRKIMALCRNTLTLLLDGKKVFINGVSIRLYAIRNETKWLQASNREIREGIAA